MTVEFYDLAQRLYAAKSGRPVLRVAAALFTVTPAAIFAEATEDAKGTVRATVGTTLPTGDVAATGADVLTELAARGARFSETDPMPQLIVPDHATLAALRALARAHRFSTDPAVKAASAVVGWWADRAGYPGSAALVNLLSHSGQRFVTGHTPASERHAAHWRTVFAEGIDGLAGLRVWAQAVGVGVVMPALQPVHEDDDYSYRAAGKRFARGEDWSAPDRAPVAAVGLRRRCDTADLWEAALRTDRLWRHRARHTGHVTGGVVGSSTRSTFTVSCARLDVRLREGSAVEGWAGGIDDYDRADPFDGEIVETHVHEGTLLLTVTGVRAVARPSHGQWVTLMAAPPDERNVRSGRASYNRLQFRPDSWITTGKTPGIRRRDVPLDVLVAAAELEDDNANL